MRDLASICTIDKVWPLEGKDRVQGASMVENGYEAMVSKDIQPGQLVAFIQEGACLPVCENWEWLRKRCYKENLNGKEGFLIKPQKFGTIKSWGLIVPLHELGLEEKVYSKFKPGQDITELLGIWKYEPEEDASPKTSSKKAYPKFIKFCLSVWFLRWIGRIWQSKHQNISGGFPSDLISKSDETSLQNMKSILEKYPDSEVYISAKLEGQSFSVIPVFKGKKFITAYPCTRNNALPREDNSIFWNMMRKYDVINKMKKLWEKEKIAVILQGEQVGPTIQNNIYDFKDNEWYVYTMKDFFTKKQIGFAYVTAISSKLGLMPVPFIASGVHKELFPDLQTAVSFAEHVVFTPSQKEDKIISFTVDNLEKLWKNYFQHEGIVVRSVDYDKDNGVGFSYKVKNSDYAEKGLGNINKAVKDYKKEKEIGTGK